MTCLFFFSLAFQSVCHENGDFHGNVSILVGFLCGTCPNGTSPDLTLTNCVTCYGWHTFLIIVIGEVI